MDGLFRFLALDQRLEDDRRERAAYQRSNDEYPHRAQCLAALEDRGTEGTSGVDGGTGEVDAEDVYQRQGQTDDQTRELLILLLRGNAQDDQDEDEGQDALDDQGGQDLSVEQAVGAEALVKADQRAEDRRARGSARELSDDVQEEVLDAHAARQQYADGDSRVDVAAGDVADGVRHRDDDQTERQSGQHVCRVRLIGAAQYGRGAAGEEYQHEGADELSDEFFHVFLSFKYVFPMT